MKEIYRLYISYCILYILCRGDDNGKNSPKVLELIRQLPQAELATIGGLLPDIILLTQCHHHRGTRLNVMKT